MMKRCFNKRCSKLTGAVKRNIKSIAHLEQEFLRQRPTVACLSDWITDIIGSPVFFVGHLVCLAAWIVVNTVDVPDVPHFDPYPCPFLALGIAVEGVLFATFVLMSQKRQTHQADHWAHVDLQVNLLAEQEATKMLQLLQVICNRLGLKKVVQDRDLQEMIKETHIIAMAQALEKAREPAESVAAERPYNEPKPAA
jgi:uncharacterized membrane protein